MGSQEGTVQLTMHLLVSFLLLGCISTSQAFFFGWGWGNSFCNGKDCSHSYNFRPCSYWNPASCVCSASSATCPSSDYAKASDGSKCYIKMTGQTSWSDAQSKCTAAGHKGLATITSTVQQTAVEGLVKDVNGAYIGLSDSATEGAFLWNDGSNINSYNNWLTVPPTNSNDKDCVRMRKNDAKWILVTCDKTSADNVDFICERKPTC